MAKNNKFILFIVFLLLGIIGVIQYKTTLDSKEKDELTTFGVEYYKAQLAKEKEENAKLQNEINEYLKRKENYLKAFAMSTSDDELQEELQKVRLEAGLLDVKGQGVVIVLNDAPARKNVDPNSLIIHDSYIVQIVNELKKAGAQAISVNGERILATSEQICTGPNIRINKTRHPVPYEIKAIGDPDLLYKAVDSCSTVNLMRSFDISVQISKSKQVLIPKYSGNLKSLVSGLEVVGE